MYLFIATSLSGCSSILMTSETPCPYSGTRTNYNIIKGCSRKDYSQPDDVVQSCSFDFCALLKTPAKIDFIPSLILDTILLPVQGIRYATSDEKGRNECKIK